MNFENDLLNQLIDSFERRKAFKRDSYCRAIQIDINKIYPEYGNRYNHEIYKEINSAIEKLIINKYVIADKNDLGRYSKIKLNTDAVQEIYKKLNRTSIPEQCDKVKKVLLKYKNSELPLLQAVVNDWLQYISEYKKLDYDLKYDFVRIENILRILKAILSLNVETYIRNFSTALLKDSKKFQKEYKSTIESILFDYTDEVVEKNSILGFYNLYENPTYVLIKGEAQIRFGTSVVELKEMPDGIALSNASLEKIQNIKIYSNKVITVENLTTYHDSDEKEAVHIYLGGYHNSSKQILLKQIYADNKDIDYFHKGDLDVYGFLILENLKEKTQIPFKPLQMDLNTLRRFYDAKLFKKLSPSDIKLTKEKIKSKLSAYSDVLQFMLDNDCKVEQESIKALELIEFNDAN